MKNIVRLDSKMQKGKNTYITAVRGVLKSLGYCNLEPEMLSCFTGYAFRLTAWMGIDCAAPHTYDAMNENLEALYKIGVSSEVLTSNSGNPTYDVDRKIAVKKIKKFLDEGYSVIFQCVNDIPEYGIINGYDENEGIFFVASSGSAYGRPTPPMLFENLGKASPHWPLFFYQIPVQKIDVDFGTMCKNAILMHIDKMEKVNGFYPFLRQGLAAYDQWISDLERDNYDPFGLRWCFHMYSESKQHIAQFYKKASEKWKPLEGRKELVELVTNIKNIYNCILEECLGMDAYASYWEYNKWEDHSKKPVAKDSIFRIIELLKEAKESEIKSIIQLKKINEYK